MWAGKRKFFHFIILIFNFYLWLISDVFSHKQWILMIKSKMINAIQFFSRNCICFGKKVQCQHHGCMTYQINKTITLTITLTIALTVLVFWSHATFHGHLILWINKKICGHFVKFQMETLLKSILFSLRIHKKFRIIKLVLCRLFC